MLSNDEKFTGENGRPLGEKKNRHTKDAKRKNKRNTLNSCICMASSLTSDAQRMCSWNETNRKGKEKWKNFANEWRIRMNPYCFLWFVQAFAQIISFVFVGIVLRICQIDTSIVFGRARKMSWRNPHPRRRRSKWKITARHDFAIEWHLVTL